MWYVIQVEGGQEEHTACLIQKQVSNEILKECFIPRKERIKKFKGVWHHVEETLFPGYVFVVTEEPEELFLELKGVTRLTRLLQDGVYHFIPLSREEEEMIRSIGDNYHVTRLSRVYVERMGDRGRPGTGAEIREKRAAGKGKCGGNRNGKLKAGETGKNAVVLDGPLKNQECRIIAYNLHKREVTVRIPFMGRDVDLKLGLELVGKKREIYVKEKNGR